MTDKKLTPEEVRTRGIVARAFGTHTVRAADQQGLARERASRERVDAARVQRENRAGGERGRTRGEERQR